MLTSVGANAKAPYWRFFSPICLFAYFFLLGIYGTRSIYSIPEALLLAFLYLLLSLTLYGILLVTFRLAKVFGFISIGLIGILMAWHLRESFSVPQQPAVFALCCIATSLLFLACNVHLFRQPYEWKAPVLATIVSACVFIISLVLICKSSDQMRWHILYSNRMIGTPYYYLFEPTVEEIRKELFNSQTPRNNSRILTSHATETTEAPNSTRMNVVFIVNDCLRADWLESNGGHHGLMPNLNKFAERSYRFTNVHSNSAWTRSSIASFFTGLVPEKHGAMDRFHILSPDTKTIAEVFKQRGYRTAAIVSTPVISTDSGFSRGFDSFISIKGKRKAIAPANEVNEKVFQLLSETDPSTPLFLYIHYLDPHSSGNRLDLYRQKTRILDQNLSALFKEMEQKISGPTAIFVTADHGEAFQEHEIIGHGHSLYREVVWIPALLRIGNTRGKTIPNRLEARDFFDLLLQCSSVNEFSVEDWANSKSRKSRYSSVYLTTPLSFFRPYLKNVALRSIENDDYRLIWSAYGSTFELYDVRNDPGELRNLAAKNPEIVSALRKEMDQIATDWTRPELFLPDPETIEQMRSLGYVK